MNHEKALASGFAVAVISLLWALFMWSSAYVWRPFFDSYASDTSGLWPLLHLLWPLITVYACLALLYGSMRHHTRLALIGFGLVLASIALTTFIISPMLWRQAALVYT